MISMLRSETFCLLITPLKQHTFLHIGSHSFILILTTIAPKNIRIKRKNLPRLQSGHKRLKCCFDPTTSRIDRWTNNSQIRSPNTTEGFPASNFFISSIGIRFSTFVWSWLYSQTWSQTSSPQPYYTSYKLRKFILSLLFFIHSWESTYDNDRSERE